MDCAVAVEHICLDDGRTCMRPVCPGQKRLVTVCALCLFPADPAACVLGVVPLDKVAVAGLLQDFVDCDGDSACRLAGHGACGVDSCNLGVRGCEGILGVLLRSACCYLCGLADVDAGSCCLDSEVLGCLVDRKGLINCACEIGILNRGKGYNGSIFAGVFVIAVGDSIVCSFCQCCGSELDNRSLCLFFAIVGLLDYAADVCAADRSRADGKFNGL